MRDLVASGLIVLGLTWVLVVGLCCDFLKWRDK